MRLTLPLTLLAAASLGALASMVQVFDYDAWMHVAAGRLILESGLPTTNSFSWTFPDFPWKDVEWGFDLLAALFHRRQGWEGIGLLQMLAAAAAFALAWDALRRQATGGLLRFLPLAGMIFLLALVETRHRFNHRPEIATLLFTALTLWLWERRPRRLPLWLFLSSAVWVNLHPGILFGLGVCVAYAAGDLLARGRSALKPGLAATAAFFAGTLLNPHFLFPYQYLWVNATGISSLGLTELDPPVFSQHLAFYLLAALLVPAAVHALRRRDWSFLLLVAAFLPASFLAKRLIPLFALAILPGLGRWVEAFSGRLSTLGFQGRFLIPSLLLLVGIGSAAWEVSAFRPAYRPGWGVNPCRDPGEVVRVIRERGLEGRIYNEYDVGSFLMAELPPGQKVFVDSRTLAYPYAFLMEVTGGGDLPARLDRWGCDLALLRRDPLLGPAFPGILLEKAGWKLVVYDGSLLLYVRAGTPDEGRLADLEFGLLDASSTAEELAAAAERDPARARAELARIEPSRLIDGEEVHRFGVAALSAGDGKMGERLYLRLSELYPDLDVAWLNLGAALRLQGREEEARERFARAAQVTRDPRMRRKAEEELRGARTP